MSSPQEKPLDLSALSDQYDVVGEYAALGQNRRYPARRREDGRDVLVTILRAAPDVAQGKAIAQFAADANLLATLSHPNVPQVIEGRWIGEDAFAYVTDRIQGITLAELLRGERMSKPRIADILADVDGVLEWARGERLSHRGVTPDTIWIERGTNRVFVSLAPTEAPKTNRPDPRDDARVIGTLALAMLTAKPMTEEHDGTLLSMRPDLPQRVAEATEKVAACTINDEAPDISAYLASLAMADAIKEGEMEVARVESEFRAQMKSEREKWEAEQEACQMANDAQAKKFAEERAEYERRAAKEREQLEGARAEVDKRRTEVQQARAELDTARAAYKQKKSELEARAKQVDRHMSELEKQKRALEKRAAQLEARAAELEQRNQELRELAALASAAAASTESAVDMPETQVGLMDRLKHVGEITRPTQEVAVVEELEEIADEPAQDDVEVAQEAVEAEEEVHAWTPIEAAEPWTVPLETDEPVRAIQYEAAAVPEPERRKRPAWMVPAGIAGGVLLLAGAAWGIGHSRANEVPLTRAVATAPATGQLANAPAAGIRTDSAAGSIATFSDSAVFAAIRDSITAADEARRIRRARAAEAEAAAAAAAAAERARPRTYTDSNGTVWSYTPPPRRDTAGTTTASPIVPMPKPDSLARPALVPPVLAPPVTLRPDTLVKPKPDTIRTRPDTVRLRTR
jgi:hypothetical protein